MLGPAACHYAVGGDHARRGAQVCLRQNGNGFIRVAVGVMLCMMPALHAPTVNPLADSGWFSVESVVDEKIVRNLIPQLKDAGAEGIIEIPLNKVVP